MSNPLRDLFFGGTAARRELVEVVHPRRTFRDVILPDATMRTLRQALVQIEKHDVLFHDWGLAERHSTGLGLAFNFAGPPGTGKTICAEAIAHSLGKALLVVRYAELESMWAGSTGKNVSAVFRWASQEDAVLLFDEADAIASRRFLRAGQGYEREANAVVNVLLRELEEFSGVVIFATNLAANFDPAFERRIRNHILFEMPGVAEREQIWKVQLHERKTPLAEDVDFRALAQQYAVSGGDIKNAVLKAAQLAIGEPGPDHRKRIHHRHFDAAMHDVLAAKSVMDQSLFGADGAAAAEPAPLPDALAATRDELQGELAVLAERLDGVALAAQRTQRAQAEASETLGRQDDELRLRLDDVARRLERQVRTLTLVGTATLLLAVAALAVALLVWLRPG